MVAYDELGPEAIRELRVESLPAIVVNDTLGNDLYVEGQEKYRILDAGCWILDAGYWMLDTGCGLRVTGLVPYASQDLVD